MRRLVVALYVVAAGCSAGCSEEAPPQDDEGLVCPAEPAAEAQAAIDSTAALTAYVSRHRTTLLPACSAIIEALGGNAPPPMDEPTAEYVADACRAAREEISAQRATVPGSTMTVTPAPCPPDSGLQTACERECGLGSTCGAFCSAGAVYGTVCAQPGVTIVGDATLQAALGPNMPAALALRDETTAFASTTSSTMQSFSELLTKLDADPLCSTQREAVAGAQMEALTAESEHDADATEATTLAAEVPAP